MIPPMTQTREGFTQTVVGCDAMIRKNISVDRRSEGARGRRRFSPSNPAT